MTSIHPEQNRFISSRECARLQSFADKFIFKGRTIENYTQISNAVPPLIARAFGHLILSHINEKEPSLPQDADVDSSILRTEPIGCRIDCNLHEQATHACGHIHPREAF